MVKDQWQLKFTKQAQKDAKKIAAAGLKSKTQQLLEILKQNPFTNPPSYEKLQGDLQGAYSRRINLQHRLVYEVIDSENTIKIIRMWSHYGE
ncbi:MAG: Txe/YoeB family addiction module toxin [Xenococcaceae cyanobacterium MO_207.B15]|nr:Txe/YoeB family addiction module toxin [Xenococcaceae cyanobacterium MO_207.B15]